MNVVAKRIAKLQKLMRERRIDIYLVPTSDYHESEYVGEHFACREYITGFTGSAGTALIGRDWARLWTDGRYFVQAEAELAGSGVKLMKMGEPGVPTVEEFLEQNMPSPGILGFDGRVLNTRMGEDLQRRLEKKNASFAYTESLIGHIWEDRPPLPQGQVWVLEEKYAGQPAEEKIAQLREEMKTYNATVHILTTLDDIAWLFNIRGGDIPCNPVPLSYMAITMEEIFLFIHLKGLSREVKAYLKGLGVTLCPYQEIYTYVQELCQERIWMEKAKANYAIFRYMEDNNRIIDRMNPTSMKKAVKNPVEIENMKAAHIRDGVAMAKFIYWVKHNVGKVPLTEWEAAGYLDGLRKSQGALEPSFTTISAYGANGAMCHYHGTKENCAGLEPKGLYLVDSGGQYLEGTTDVTRTIALGPVTDQEKEHYTLVLMAMLRLGQVKFKAGCSGLSLDYVARELFWQRGLNYNHGTGHGVGYLLNVHERPVGIRFQTVPERQDGEPFVPGMVCSNEPGIYIEGSHGVRTENLMFCKMAEKTEYGQFLKFEYLTYVPIDQGPIDLALMEERDIACLNRYHQQVYEKISPYLDEDEAKWLWEATRPLKKGQ
ncbi:MAG: aminopeptidase P family protein [Lachnospiraceae bacterium]|nr:aminopeptidase P family protein [Lachnospiraceae bacterium]MCI9185162.1 aminopeptidase P family protein [Lachnospiraceae bacterium]